MDILQCRSVCYQIEGNETILSFGDFSGKGIFVPRSLISSFIIIRKMMIILPGWLVTISVNLRPIVGQKLKITVGEKSIVLKHKSKLLEFNAVPIPDFVYLLLDKNGMLENRIPTMVDYLDGWKLNTEIVAKIDKLIFFLVLHAMELVFTNSVSKDGFMYQLFKGSNNQSLVDYIKSEPLLKVRLQQHKFKEDRKVIAFSNEESFTIISQEGDEIKVNRESYLAGSQIIGMFLEEFPECHSISLPFSTIVIKTFDRYIKGSRDIVFNKEMIPKLREYILYLDLDHQVFDTENLLLLCLSQNVIPQMREISDLREILSLVYPVISFRMERLLFLMKESSKFEEDIVLYCFLENLRSRGDFPSKLYRNISNNFLSWELASVAFFFAYAA